VAWRKGVDGILLFGGPFRIITSIIVSMNAAPVLSLQAANAHFSLLRPSEVVTNHPEHDPDIQHVPFFAISPKFFGSLWSTYYKRVMAFDAFSRVMIGIQ
jgi:hypothetical protein